MRDGYRPKMLLYTLNELFYIFDQVKRQRGLDEKIVIAYEILCLSTLRCTERWHGLERTGMPDALSLMNVNDSHHLEHLAWAVYDGALLVGGWPNFRKPPLVYSAGRPVQAHLQGPRGCGPLPATHAGLLGLPGEG